MLYSLEAPLQETYPLLEECIQWSCRSSKGSSLLLFLAFWPQLQCSRAYPTHCLRWSSAKIYGLKESIRNAECTRRVLFKHVCACVYHIPVRPVDCRDFQTLLLGELPGSCACPWKWAVPNELQSKWLHVFPPKPAFVQCIPTDPPCVVSSP